ncbi:MAG: DUF2520 domain-containing protein [Sphingobacteriales bacterium]|nr:MAG: DUF2520 domain-containing protein [Sphingobacteriales bacterium]
MKFTIVGTGNMAWFLTGKLVAAGHTCVAVYGRDITNATALAKKTNTGANLLSDCVKVDADCCIVAVSDSAIEEVVPFLPVDTTIIFTAGTIDMKRFTRFNNKAVLWPVYSIVKDNLPAHRNIPCVWEASDSNAKNIVLKIANAITDITYEGDADKRKALHLGAVFSNNFSNHLFTIAEQWCKEQGLQFDMLKPIIQQTVDRLATASPHSLQTGPAKRGDENTINKHLDLLQVHRDWQKVYEALTASILHTYNK